MSALQIIILRISTRISSKFTGNVLEDSFFFCCSFNYIYKVIRNFFIRYRVIRTIAKHIYELNNNFDDIISSLDLEVFINYTDVNSIAS